MEHAVILGEDEVAAAAPPAPLLSLGRWFYALPMVAFGVLYLAVGDLTPRFLPGWPAWLPGRAGAPYVLGALLIVSGLAVLLERGGRAGALCIAALIAVSLLVGYVPRILARPGFGGAWTGPAKYLSLLGGALLLARLARGDGRPSAAGRADSESTAAADCKGSPTFAPRLFLSAFLILGGIQHFVYESFVATLIPGWIPGHVFWSRFAGVALIAGGLGLWAPRRRIARLAAISTGVMIFLWFLILHIPRAAAAPSDPLEWSGVFESLATSGIALLLAGWAPGPSRSR
ncbi:MAG TPA: hypothetical protein VGK26_11680 [Thermoanaerobaculia bacterium]|jgi:uncharacterized membrane protein